MNSCKFFCEEYLKIYGEDLCTPNLHLHGHLASCVKDYGPVYAFWLFSFERLNGILGSFHTNNRDISAQVMRCFANHHKYMSHHHKYMSHTWPTEFQDKLVPLHYNIIHY